MLPKRARSLKAKTRKTMEILDSLAPRVELVARNLYVAPTVEISAAADRFLVHYVSESIPPIQIVLRCLR